MNNNNKANKILKDTVDLFRDDFICVYVLAQMLNGYLFVFVMSF